MKVPNSNKSSIFLPFMICLLFLPIAMDAQIIDTFPKDSAQFIGALGDYMENRIDDDNEDALDRFIHYWETGKFDASKRDSIVTISNALLHNKATREPYFADMIRVMNRMNQTRFDSLYFTTWMNGFNHLMNLPKRKLAETSDFFRFTLDFLNNNGLNLTRTREWYATGSNYRLVYDTTLKVRYPETRIICKQRDDSIQIYETRGTYFPFRKIWQGQGGNVTWERAGYSTDQIQARLSNYRIDLTKAEYQADSVLFFNELYFDEPIRGKLHDKLHHIIKPQDAIFPTFNSYRKVFEIENIYDNMDFIGGFQMKGAQFIGSGGKGKDATLKVHRNGQIFMTAHAQVFTLKKDKALSNNAAITIHLRKDSIYHNGLSFNYNVKNQEIELIPNESILSKSVYYNTYHQVSMKFDRLLWNTNEDRIYFTHSRNSSMGKATFTSMNYFTLDKWLQLEMRDKVHPLIGIRNYHNQIGGRKFDAGEYAKYMRLPTYQVRQRLMYLAQDGFLFYDLPSDTVTINDKLFDYIQARIGKIDYDVIQIESATTSSSHNAILDLSNLDMHIKGVERTFVSDSQNVVLYPDQSGLIMKKNRNFDFGGVVVAGLFTFFGDSLSFSYEDFNITMNRIDSLRMKYQTDEYNKFGHKLLANVQNTVSDLSGVLSIDHPNNKSGKLRFPKYPIFEANKKSYVYYDDLFDGPYKRENFYFELYPFTMDSLDNFQPEKMKYHGMFHSADIFPPFEQTLELRDDNSLGFQKTTQDKGLPLYEGKGTYYKHIDMSNRGLRGDGEMTFLTARAKTDSILFFPDSTSIHARELTIEQSTTGIEYPQVASRKVDIEWYPNENDMHIWQTNQPFDMFNGRSTLEGYINLKPTGLTGKGKMDMKKASLASPHYEFKALAFDADTANFRLRTLSREAVAFQSDTLKAHVDYNYQRARFRTLSEYNKSEFPQNLYASYLDEFFWKLDTDELVIESTPDGRQGDKLSTLRDNTLEGALFMSTHLSQDSLRFASPEAIFNIADTTLTAKQVKYLHVADAKICPKEETLQVEKQANIDTLRQARLIADHSIEAPHQIFNASLKVKGRKNFGGNGDYKYEGQQDRSQVIHFHTLGVDDSLHTFARGNIAVTDSFTLSPYFGFAGDVHLASRRNLLKFEGSAKMMHACSMVRPRYARFESIIDPMEVYIPFGNKNTDIKGKKLFVGPYITIDSAHVYPTFLTPRKDASDNPVLASHGYLSYNPENDRYEIASKQRLEKKERLSSYVALDRTACNYYAEGKMNLGVDFGEMAINPVGSMKHNLKTNKVTMNLTLPMQFLFSQAALDTMARDLNRQTTLEDTDPNTAFYKDNLYRIVGEAPANQYLNALNAADSAKTKKKKMPASMEHSILFSDLEFEWNTSTNSYVAIDDIHVAVVNGKPVNKKMDGYIEIVRQRFGDKIYVYLTPDNENYYFFYYFRGMMRTSSTNKDFVRAIEDVPNRKRKISRGLGNTTYRYILSTPTSLSRFRKHMADVLKDIQGARASQDEKEKQEQEKEQSAESSGPKEEMPR